MVHPVEQSVQQLDNSWEFLSGNQQSVHGTAY